MPFEYKLLEVKNLNTSFKIDAGKVLAVNGVSFNLDKGKILGIVGESGSGKSVTAYSIMQILDKNGKVDSGKIIYNGTDLLRLSEKEMRRIRGNRISIIFQDAMTSLNPTWSIGNQLREAILTHAKNPIKDALYEIENQIKSDEQRIISLKKGIANHPERNYLKSDLEFVENKLINDKALLETKRVELKNNFIALKKTKDEEYKAAKPEFNKAIKEVLKNHLKNYFALNERPKVEDLMKEKEAQILNNAVNNCAHSFKKQKEVINALKEEFKNKEHKTAEDRAIYLRNLTNEQSILANAKKELVNAKADLKKHLRRRSFAIRFAPRKERRNLVKKAYRNKLDFKYECISAYKETRYSASKKALQMLIDVGITEPEKRMKQYPFELSGGMLQRCMIAMALVERPDILIADEPTTALDVTIQAQILELLKKLQKEYGMAIIIITHDLGVVAQICDEVDIMYAGRIVERGSVDDIFYHPQHEYTKGLINSMPKIDTVGRLEPIQGNPVDLFCLPKGCAFSSRCKHCMEICIEKYPEEVQYSKEGHAASCWKMIKDLHDARVIDIVKGEPEGKPLTYNGAIIHNVKSRKGNKQDEKAN